jgi:pimeloyl-ACP methyl ester carboxylesterase
MNEATATLSGTEHWADKDGVKLFLWNKCAVDPAAAKGVVLFVHGSSMPGQPTFDFHMPGRPNASAMEFFARCGYDTWALDMEGYGRSTKTRDNNAPTAMTRRAHASGAARVGTAGRSRTQIAAPRPPLPTLRSEREGAGH